MDREKAGLVHVGRVSGVHSIRGELKLLSYSGELEQLLQYKRLHLLLPGQEAAQPYTVQQARLHKDRVLVQLHQCKDRNQAEQLLQAEVYVAAEELPAPGEDEFYLRDLEGKQMLTEEGQVLGRITGIMLTHGQALAQVQGQGQEYLIPLVPAFLLALDEQSVRVRLPPGLLDINA